MEKYVLQKVKLSKNCTESTLTIYRDGKDVYLSFTYNLLSLIDVTKNVIRFDGPYDDIETGKRFFINIKVTTNDNSTKDNEFMSGTLETTIQEFPEGKCASNYNNVKFSNTEQRLHLSVVLPKAALTHKEKPKKPKKIKGKNKNKNKKEKEN